MSDYMPVYQGATFTATTSAAVTAGQVLEVSGTGTVAPAGAASKKVVGVAAFDAASGARVTVYGRGPIHETPNAGGVTAGDQLAAAASGQVATLAAATGDPAASDVNNARAVIGVALTTATDTNKVRWMAL